MGGFGVGKCGGGKGLAPGTAVTEIRSQRRVENQRGLFDLAQSRFFTVNTGNSFYNQGPCTAASSHDVSINTVRQGLSCPAGSVDLQTKPI